MELSPSARDHIEQDKDEFISILTGPNIVIGNEDASRPYIMPDELSVDRFRKNVEEVVDYNRKTFRELNSSSQDN